jgi:hypothetical protein
MYNETFTREKTEVMNLRPYIGRWKPCAELLISIEILLWKLGIFILYHTDNALLHTCQTQSSLWCMSQTLISVSICITGMDSLHWNSFNFFICNISTIKLDLLFLNKFISLISHVWLLRFYNWKKIERIPMERIHSNAYTLLQKELARCSQAV